MEKHLIKTLVDMAIFLEYTDPSLLDEDVAVAVLEQMSSELQQMAADERKSLSQQIVALSSSYDGERREFVKKLPSALGIS